MNFNSLVWYLSLAIGDEKKVYFALKSLFFKLWRREVRKNK